MTTQTPTFTIDQTPLKAVHPFVVDATTGRVYLNHALIQTLEAHKVRGDILKAKVIQHAFDVFTSSGVLVHEFGDLDPPDFEDTPFSPRVDLTVVFAGNKNHGLSDSTQIVTGEIWFKEGPDNSPIYTYTEASQSFHVDSRGGALHDCVGRCL